MKLIPVPIRHLYHQISGLGLASERRRVCTGCRGVRFERVPRIGLVQAQILPFFNLYPWRCVLCNRVIYRTLRTNEQDPGNRF
ncbi:hypothetical protein Terro_3426 [Terriglobus roseus DSM 18391]|uniref:Uncharacterized protein n=1 Tax=Terriglobus roseus (strain DSM 18391 / NRRL B-41598 / KBS 63) TaxID=926566 RepID=I3ZK73_TERRK|nr:hypothetical protein [Terriglobus roseus]AFL89641.1 hypothetical protein Terro_3426 [Terriglobus roseus DSM 18391]